MAYLAPSSSWMRPNNFAPRNRIWDYVFLVQLNKKLANACSCSSASNITFMASKPLFKGIHCLANIMLRGLPNCDISSVYQRLCEAFTLERTVYRTSMTIIYIYIVIYLSVAPVIFTFVAVLLIFAPIRKLTQHY